MSDFDDFFNGDFDWEEMGMLGALAEEMSEEEKERLRLERELEMEEEPCCCKDKDNDDDRDPSGEEFIP
jgi:hypothetical protein